MLCGKTKPLFNPDVKIVSPRLTSISSLNDSKETQNFLGLDKNLRNIRNEPPRVCRRPVCLSYAALGILSSAA